MKFKKQKHLLTQREEANAFRVLRPEADLIDFCSNDYLGLAKKVKEKGWASSILEKKLTSAFLSPSISPLTKSAIC